MQPEDVPGTDPNTLPYFITEAQTNRRVPVRFEPLTPRDAAELQNEDWAQAVFAPVWLHLVNVERVLKLTCLGRQDRRIQGLVHLGVLDGERRFLVSSLLESAPFNRTSGLPQDYRGIGRVLTARLAAESVMLGGQGRVIVQPRAGTEGFYESLGFMLAFPVTHRYVLNTERAQLLLQSVLSKQV